MDDHELRLAISDAIAPISERLDRLLAVVERSLGEDAYAIAEPVRLLVQASGDGKFLKVSNSTGISSWDYPTEDGRQSITGRITRLDVVCVKAHQGNRDEHAMLIIDIATSPTSTLSVNVGHATTVAARSLICAIASAPKGVLDAPVRITFELAERAKNAVFASIVDANGKELVFRQSLKALPEDLMHVLITGAIYDAIAQLDVDAAKNAAARFVQVVAVPVPVEFAIVLWRLNRALAIATTKGQVKKLCGDFRTAQQVGKATPEMDALIALHGHHVQRLEATNAA